MSSLAFASETDWLSKHLTLLANDIGNAIGQKRGAPPAGDHKGRPYYATNKSALQARP